MKCLSITIQIALFLTTTTQCPAGSGHEMQSSAQVQQQNLAQSCKKFVQDFYTWYRFGKPQPTEEIVLKQKKSLLSPALHKALKDDFDASARNQDEVVGLDFDPFFNSQEYAEKYVVGDAKRNGAYYLVEVWGIWDGKKREKPDVVAEAQNVNGKWMFTNMHYGKHDNPADENLLSVLNALKKNRTKPR